MNDIESRLRSFFEKKGFAGVENGDRLEELQGWDSITHAEFLIFIQKEFRVRFSPADFDRMRTLSEVGRLIAEKSK
jgi:acyl carrier protein